MSESPLDKIAELWSEVLHPPKVATVGGTHGKQGSRPPANLDGLELRSEAHELAKKAGYASFYGARHVKQWGGSWLALWQALADKFVSLARPEQIQGVYIGKCPQCNEDKRWHEGQTLMVCECGLFGSKKKWIEYMQPEEVPSQMTTVELAAFLSGRLDREIEPALIRKWESRGKIASFGKDERRRCLYRPLDVLAWVRAHAEGLNLPMTQKSSMV